MVQIYTGKDGSLDPFKGTTIAVIGYASQGRAHAGNLRDSGFEVARSGGNGFEAVGDGGALRVAHGFSVLYGEVAARSDIDVILVAPKGPGDLVRPAYEPAWQLSAFPLPGAHRSHGKCGRWGRLTAPTCR